MNASQFERWLKKRGIEVRSRNRTGHKHLRNPATGQTSSLSTHGSRQQLSKEYRKEVCKQLGLNFYED